MRGKFLRVYILRLSDRTKSSQEAFRSSQHRDDRMRRFLSLNLLALDATWSFQLLDFYFFFLIKVQFLSSFVFELKLASLHVLYFSVQIMEMYKSESMYRFLVAFLYMRLAAKKKQKRDASSYNFNHKSFWKSEKR
jgi:hypothetical protein